MTKGPPINPSGAEDFQVHPGRLRDRGAKTQIKRHAAQILQKMAKAVQSGGRSSQPGNGMTLHYGKGAGLGRIFAAKFGAHPGRWRRVIIQARIVKLRGRGLSAAKRHLSYLHRDGITISHDRGKLYNAVADDLDGKEFLEPCQEDRHQFRFIVSAEDGTKLGDLKPFVRDLMARCEQDLETRLDWVAVDHFNTGHPHSHIVVRGKTDHGTDLVIARDYISHGLRHRASELLTRDLGRQTALEIEHKLTRQIGLETFTDIDRQLVKIVTADHVLKADALTGQSAFTRALQLGRLRHLASLGLATKISAQEWQLTDNWQATLKSLGQRHDINKTLHRALTFAGRDSGSTAAAITDLTDPDSTPIIGKVIGKGLHDELRDQSYALVDATDGRVHYLPLPRSKTVEEMKIEQIVSMAPAARQLSRDLPDRKLPVPQIKLLSTHSLDQQVVTVGPTWLDRQLVGQTVTFGQGPFAVDVKSALLRRRQQLTAWGLADAQGLPKSGLLSKLSTREVAITGSAAAAQFGKPVTVLREGDTYVGKLVQTLDLNQGRLAVLENSEALLLVKWAKGMDQDRTISIEMTQGALRMRTINRAIDLPDRG
jgi:type IV secretory pathway VirD2 relaxase